MLRRHMHRLRRDQRGVSAVEFALVLPVLVVLALGAYEVPRLLLIDQKLTRVTSEIGDLVARQQTGITGTQLQDLFKAGAEIMQPFSFTDVGAVIVSAITRPTTAAATIAWQCVSTNSIVATSKIGGSGKKPALPPNFVVNTGDEVIVAEVVYNYQPVFGSYILDSQQIYDVSYFRPRGDTLSTIGNGCGTGS